MWTAVENELATMLSTRVFHTLTSDPAYVLLFRRAGFQGKLPADLEHAPAGVRAKLLQSARMCAQLLRMDVESKHSLRERRAKAVVLEGPVTLYRLWSNQDQNRTRPWWFSPNLLSQALGETGNDRAQAIAWLRDRLAISLDFGACDRLAALNLGMNSALPAIAAWGLPMPQYTASALQSKSPPSRPDYFAKRSQVFQGQKTQYFLPFIPATRTSDYW